MQKIKGNYMGKNNKDVLKSVNYNMKIIKRIKKNQHFIIDEKERND